MKKETKKEAEEKVSRMTVLLPPSFHKEIKQFALDNDMNVSDVVRAAVTKYIGSD